jgi:hypothetical protein
MEGFHAQVEKVKARMLQTAPFDAMTQALRICRIETPSNTDKIGVAAGDTYFKARFSSGEVSRVLEVDQEIAGKVLDGNIPGRARAIIIVNTATYGGAGGAATVFSCEPSWSADIAIHELGHSHFSLADEYVAGGYSGQQDPSNPNVSGDYRREGLKWSHLVAPETPLPTWQTEQEPPPGTPPVGAFQGAKYMTTLWRPSFHCKMRNVETATFCPVCREEIATQLRDHMP